MFTAWINWLLESMFDDYGDDKYGMSFRLTKITSACLGWVGIEDLITD